MNTIILDLEFCKVKTDDKDIMDLCRHEIIQIGAVKLDDQNQVISTFDTLVKPRYSVISKKIEKLTSITNDMVADAPEFTRAVDAFLSWIGEGEAVIYSWSMNDADVLEREALVKDYTSDRLEELFKSWVDLQEIVDTTIGVDNNLSLENVLKGLDIAFEGHQHTALDDALNTAAIYQVLQDGETFKKKMAPIIELFKPSEEMTFSLGSLLQGIVLESCTA